MNMNKALQNLYHAVSGSTTTKVNISKLLVDIHYAITDKESENKNNWSKIINSMADNWPEGGGGSSDFSTAEVTVTSNGGPAVEVYGILRDAGEIVGLPDSFYAVDDYNDNPTGEITLTIVLYQGHALMAVWDANTISKSGNIETIFTPDSGEIFDITGDCTITIS